MTAPAPISVRQEAKERFYRAALWWMADQSCSNALAELEDAYADLSALGKEALAEVLARADARRALEAA